MYAHLTALESIIFKCRLWSASFDASIGNMESHSSPTVSPTGPLITVSDNLHFLREVTTLQHLIANAQSPVSRLLHMDADQIQRIGDEVAIRLSSNARSLCYSLGQYSHSIE